MYIVQDSCWHDIINIVTVGMEFKNGGNCYDRIN